MIPKQNSLSRIKYFILAAVMICIAQTRIFGAENKNEKISSKNFIDHDKKKGKKNKSQSGVTVKVIPDVIKRAMHIVARSDNEKELSFSVFDTEGNLVVTYKMKAGERKIISDLQRGKYVYNVFCDEEQVATGKMEFR
jgi:hypothetical protein